MQKHFGQYLHCLKVDIIHNVQSYVWQKDIKYSLKINIFLARNLYFPLVEPLIKKFIRKLGFSYWFQNFDIISYNN